MSGTADPKAARDHARPKAIAVKIDLAVFEADLAGVHIFGLQLGPDIGMEGRAMRAGERSVFDHLHLGIGGTEREILDLNRRCGGIGGGLLRLRRAKGQKGKRQSGGQFLEHGHVPFHLLRRVKMFCPKASRAARNPGSPMTAAVSAALA